MHTKLTSWNLVEFITDPFPIYPKSPLPETLTLLFSKSKNNIIKKKMGNTHKKFFLQYSLYH